MDFNFKFNSITFCIQLLGAFAIIRNSNGDSADISTNASLTTEYTTPKSAPPPTFTPGSTTVELTLTTTDSSSSDLALDPGDDSGSDSGNSTGNSADDTTDTGFDSSTDISIDNSTDNATDLVMEPDSDNTIPGEDGETADTDDIISDADTVTVTVVNSTLSYDAYTYDEAIAGNSTNGTDSDYNSSDSNSTNPIDQETYYKYNTTDGDECPHCHNGWSYYAGRSSVILTVVFVTTGLLIIACLTYRNIVRIVPTEVK